MTMPHQHNHNDTHEGFLADLAGGIGRRGLLTLLAGTAAGAAGLGFLRAAPGHAEANVSGTGSDGAACVAIPTETNGPYPADGTNAFQGSTVNVLTESGVIRQDIRPSFAGYQGTADGIPLEIELRIIGVEGCAPRPGAAVYIWHCDAAGGYSIYGVTSANYLRGMQIADDQGRVRFTTILPGTYPGRWPHVHFEVFDSVDAAVSGNDARLVAQIAFEGEALKALYAADPRYAGSVGPLDRISLASDNVFRDNTPEQIAQQTLKLSGDGTGLSGALVVPVKA
jgi:protocatechuate 3,4-dioxygenase beta subunit